MSGDANVVALRPQQIRVLEVLLGHQVHGLAAKHVAAAIGAIPVATIRVLEELAALGLTQRVPEYPGRWRLGPTMLRIADAHDTEREQCRGTTP